MSRLIITEQASAPATPAAQKVGIYADNSSPPRLKVLEDTGLISTEVDTSMALVNASVGNSTGFAADTYLPGSTITIPVAGQWRVGCQYRCCWDMVKTAAGTAATSIIVRMGTLGALGDAAVLTLNFAVGTAAIDTGIYELTVNFRTVGSGTSAIINGIVRLDHHLAATGLATTGAAGTGIIIGTSAGFNSTTQTKIGISFNGGTSFAGTNTQVQATAFNF